MRTKEEVIAKIKKVFAGDTATRDELLKAWEQDGKQPVRPEMLTTKGPEAVSKGGRIGIPYYYGYDNYSQSPGNTCGQAVIASAVDYFGLNPYNLKKVTGTDGYPHFIPDEILGNIYRDFGPSLNIATVRETIMAAFKTYGLTSDEVYPGAFSNGEDAKAWLKDWIAKYNLPVIVLIDAGTKLIGGKPGSLHWCTVFAYDDSDVYIATWGRVISATWQDFMDAWHCWVYPYPNNYYAIHFWK